MTANDAPLHRTIRPDGRATHALRLDLFLDENSRGTEVMRTPRPTIRLSVERCDSTSSSPRTAAVAK
jgi:hypothetical protein